MAVVFEITKRGGEILWCVYLTAASYGELADRSIIGKDACSSHRKDRYLFLISNDFAPKTLLNAIIRQIKAGDKIPFFPQNKKHRQSNSFEIADVFFVLACPAAGGRGCRSVSDEIPEKRDEKKTPCDASLPISDGEHGKLITTNDAKLRD